MEVKSLIDSKDDSQIESKESKIYPLTDIWTFWFNNGKSWKRDSYNQVLDFATIGEFWSLYNNHPSLSCGHIYLMKKNKFPSWEDHVNGIRWSFMVPKNHLFNTWLELTMALIGCTLFKDEKYMNLIDGIEIQCSQRYTKGIIKIWLNKNIDIMFDVDIKYLDMKNKKVLLNNKS